MYTIDAICLDRKDHGSRMKRFQKVTLRSGHTKLFPITNYIGPCNS